MYIIRWPIHAPAPRAPRNRPRASLLYAPSPGAVASATAYGTEESGSFAPMGHVQAPRSASHLAPARLARCFSANGTRSTCLAGGVNRFLTHSGSWTVGTLAS